MKYKKFIIKNFKGINELEIDFSKQPAGKIFPLVGLNESGKTTILEAINLFQERYEEGKEHELIHKKKIGNFTDEISVEAEIELEQNDKQVIDEFLTKKRLSQKEEINTITIAAVYKFNNTEFEYINNVWDIPLQVKRYKQKKYVDLYDYDNNHEIFIELAHKLKENIPKILYFPNFLFEFPEKIYLEDVGNSSETLTDTQKQYRKVLQDILDSLESDFDINEHILDRMRSNDTANKESLEAVLSKMSAKLDATIINSWQQVFKDSPKKKVTIFHKLDESNYYLEFKISESSKSFSINERSLGFRWLFGFLLFTEFRKARTEEKGEYLFLFDEPASNLHQSHQQQLLDLFEKLTDTAKIIYSTHSHHLLNSKFLLNTFIVKDNGIQENIEEDYAQDIKAIPYKQFVTDYPDEKTHFSPILDVLDYVEHSFLTTNKIVFVEGKFDYYTFKWIKKTLFEDNKEYDFRFYPGTGANTYEKIFREYLAHNRKFIAIFDDDNAGKKAKKTYIKNVSVELQNNIFTLSDINKCFANYTTEELFTKADKLEIQKNSDSLESQYNKNKFNAEILELFIKDKRSNLSNESKENLKNVFDFIKDKFDALYPSED